MARIVLVHGAFGGAWCWEPVIPGLEAAGHEVTAIDLPALGEDQTPPGDVTLDSYADRAVEALEAGDEPAVLVGHSMGGMVISHAAGRAPERIARLVYVCAFLPGEGKSLLDMAGLPEGADDQIQKRMIIEPPVGRLEPEDAAIAVHNTTSAQDTAWATARMRPQALAPMAGPVARGDGFDAIPKSYVVCTQDQAVPPALQRRMLAEGGVEDVHELDTDHSPYLSKTDELTAILVGLADRV
jgi:pimeloyl-ACP methyl ester carboxylesterase